MHSVFRVFRADTLRLTALAVVGFCIPATAEEAPRNLLDADFAELAGEASVELTLFPQEAAFAGQEEQSISLALKPRASLEWDEIPALGASASASLVPFIRIDPIDDARTHVDLREAKLDLRFGQTDVTIGNDIVYWGKAEADQIVDIVNQVDGVEGTDGEDKLGQPMIAVRRLVEAGEFSGQASLFYFPYFRERTFLGSESRLRGPVVVVGEDARYETGAEEWTPSFAARLAGFYGDIDAGVHVFHGLSRDPAFEPNPNAPGTLRPVYGEITQIGLDGQYTRDATLWKLEAVARFGQRDLAFEEQDYVAAVGGLEHTLYGVFGTPYDLGLIAEYAYDGRGDRALTPLNNDAIVGARLALNDAQDTSALLTAAVDTETSETLLRLEGERRIGDAFKLELEAAAFLNTDESSLIDGLRDDHHLRLTLSMYW